ncbi:MAG: zinc ribbon domain-containing protein [Acetobacteraceae bacterium]|nr:zinc ribbon domain-containing protein [Acetobacteraceae bacterium]
MTTEPNAGPEAQFRAFLAEGRLMLQRSRSTGRYVFFPRVAAPGTGERDLEWVEASGLGTVYATTVTRQRPNP